MHSISDETACSDEASVNCSLGHCSIIVFHVFNESCVRFSTDALCLFNGMIETLVGLSATPIASRASLTMSAFTLSTGWVHKIDDAQQLPDCPLHPVFLGFVRPHGGGRKLGFLGVFKLEILLRTMHLVVSWKRAVHVGESHGETLGR